MSEMGRRKYSKEFKLEAVRLATQPGTSTAEIADNLGVHRSQINAWQRQFEADGYQAFPGNGRLKPDDEEIRKLRRELKQVRDERDILKRATLFFAKESQKR